MATSKTTKQQRSRAKRILIDIAGFGLMFVAPLLGWLPGPGGIPLFLAGLGLVSTNHAWAKRLLENFDVRRVEFTNKYLMTSWAVSLVIDIICITILCVGLFVSFTNDELIMRAVGLGLTSVSLIIILSNQKRLDRIFAKFKNK